MGVPAAHRPAGPVLSLLIVAISLSGCLAGEAGGASVGEWVHGARDVVPARSFTATAAATALASATLTAPPPTATTEAAATFSPTSSTAPAAAQVPTAGPSPAAALPATADLVTRVEPGQGEIALLFNADWFEGHIASILDTARDYEAKFTFFLTGGYLERYPDRVAEIDAAGHDIASHGYRHADYRDLSDEEIVSQIDLWRDKFRELTGKTGPAYWQPPYGYSNDRVRQAAAGQGYTTIYWTLDVLDAVGKPKSKQFVLDRVLQSSIDLDGAIILMHVDKGGTVAALPEILDALAQRGLRAVTVSELLRH